MTPEKQREWLSEYWSLKADSRAFGTPKGVKEDATMRLFEHIKGSDVPLRHLQWAHARVLAKTGKTLEERAEVQRQLINTGPGMRLAKAFKASKEDPLEPSYAEEGMVAIVECVVWWARTRAGGRRGRPGGDAPEVAERARAVMDS